MPRSAGRRASVTIGLGVASRDLENRYELPVGVRNASPARRVVVRISTFAPSPDDLFVTPHVPSLSCPVEPFMTGDRMECSRCKEKFPLDSGFKYGGAWICYGCKPRRVGGVALILCVLVVGALVAVPLMFGSEWFDFGAAASTGPSTPGRTEIVLELASDDADTSWVKAGDFVVSGTAPTGSRSLTLELGGDTSSHPVDGDGRFSIPLTLTPGVEHLVVLRSDDVGKSELRRKIVVDATAPLLELVSPELEARLTRSDTFDVRVRVTEDNVSTARIGARPLRATGDGIWSAAFVPLEEGEQVFPIRVEDRAGNITTLELAMHRDVAPPSVLARVPGADETIEFQDTVRVEFEFDEELASAELAGSALTVTESRASGEIAWPDQLGTWTAKLVCEDRLGNRGEIDLPFELRRAAAQIVVERVATGTLYYASATATVVGQVSNPWCDWVETKSDRVERKHPLDVDGRFSFDVPGGPALQIRTKGAEPMDLFLVHDDVAPELTVVRPVSTGEPVRAPSVDVLVTVADANLARVRCGDQDMERGESDGEWCFSVLLSATSPTQIRIEAEDLAGNRSERALIVQRDVTKPKVERVSLVGDNELKPGQQVRIRVEFDEPIAGGDLGGVTFDVTENAVEQSVVLPMELREWKVAFTVRDLAGNVQSGTIGRVDLELPTEVQLKPNTRGYVGLKAAKEDGAFVRVSGVATRLESTADFVKVRRYGGAVYWVKRSAIVE